ncbi:MAG TPA: helix-turn-helix transcriptional regulator [Pirellulales bacterium]|nr:helix-turn-helix transcriptional regulator [Pirellulales bacterium]
MLRQVVMRKGKRFVLVEERELRRLERLAGKAQEADESPLPAWPPADEQGRRPALAFARVSIARSIMEERRAAGLTQEELARLAGVRQETICRLESGKHSPTVRTVAKIDKVLQAALRKAGKAQAAKPSGRASTVR